MSSAGTGPRLSDGELADLEDRFAITCLDAVVLGVLTPAEVTTIQRRLRQMRQMRRENSGTATAPPAPRS